MGLLRTRRRQNCLRRPDLELAALWRPRLHVFRRRAGGETPVQRRQCDRGLPDARGRRRSTARARDARAPAGEIRSENAAAGVRSRYGSPGAIAADRAGRSLRRIIPAGVEGTARGRHEKRQHARGTCVDRESRSKRGRRGRLRSFAERDRGARSGRSATRKYTFQLGGGSGRSSFAMPTYKRNSSLISISDLGSS